MFQTPILFIIFNRPENTLQVFSKIREMKPKYLFIAADGPRNENKDDSFFCDKTRKTVLNNIDWECETRTLFREKNLGCGKAVSSAISWFFENVDEGIILEDDCVPSADFFYFCSNLLEKYRNNNKIFVIGGNNFQKNQKGNASYYFSAYGHIWGWATWKRAWDNYDYEMKNISEIEIIKCIKNYFSVKQVKEYWLDIFKKMKKHSIDTWDYQWTFTQWFCKGINVTPNINLVKNIGFGIDATHTKDLVDGVSNLEALDLGSLKHPSKIKINRRADMFSFYKIYQPKPKKNHPFIKKCRDKIKYEFSKGLKFLKLS